MWKYDTPNARVEIAGVFTTTDEEGFLPADTVLSEGLVRALQESPHFSDVPQPPRAQSALGDELVVRTKKR